MKHLAPVPAILVLSLLSSCSTPPLAPRAPAGGATALLTRPVLKPIDIRSRVTIVRRDVRITVTPDGLLRCEAASKKTNPGDDANERPEIRQGQLTPDQMTELATLFADWDKLDPQYPEVSNGFSITLQYGDKQISGGIGLPRHVIDAYQKLRNWGGAMPLQTQPAP